MTQLARHAQRGAGTDSHHLEQSAGGPRGATNLRTGSLASVGSPSDLLGERIDALLPGTVELYEDLHRHPELSGQEHRTAGRLAEALADRGYQVTTGVGGTGVVGVSGTGAGPVVLLRAELDALPIAERTGLPYASRVRTADADGTQVPVMHACGHDAHIAALAAAAGLLAETACLEQGTIVVVGQPAEETLSGARAMLADGLYTRFPRPDAVLAQHLAPIPAGVIVHGTGVALPAGATVELVVHGTGGHAGMPRSTVNPIETIASIVSRLRRLTIPDELVVTVGAVHAGRRANIVPDQARLDISLRSRSAAGIDAAITAITRLAQGEARGHGVEVTVVARSPVTINDPHHGATIRRAHRALFGDRSMAMPGLSMATEDFALLGPAGVDLYGGPPIPAVYWSLGSVGARRWRQAPGATARDKLAALPGNHSSGFAPDPEPTLRTGISALVSAAWACLQTDRSHSDADRS